MKVNGVILDRGSRISTLNFIWTHIEERTFEVTRTLFLLIKKS